MNYDYFISNERTYGKLWLFWKDQNAFEVISCMSQLVSGWLVFVDHKMLVTFVYAKCSYVGKKRELWHHLEAMQVLGMPWMVLGDFNVIRIDLKRISGNPKPFYLCQKLMIA